MRDKGGGWGTTGGNKQGIGTWGGGEEVQQWEAPEQTPEPLRGWDQELGRESEGHSLTLRSLGKTSEGTCHPPAPDTTQGAEGERNVLGNACVGGGHPPVASGGAWAGSGDEAGPAIYL